MGINELCKCLVSDARNTESYSFDGNMGQIYGEKERIKFGDGAT